MVPQCENSSVQSISREGDYGWLAGIIDGEGNIQAVMKEAINGKCYLNPKIRIANTDARMIKRISEIYKDLGVVWFYTARNNRAVPGKNWRNQLSIEISSQGSVLKVLKAVHPFLVNKRDAAKILIELIEFVMSIPKGGNTTSYHYAECAEFKDRLVSFRETYTFFVEPSTTKRRACEVITW